MKDIIYDLEKLSQPAEPLTILTETGITDEEGKAIITELTEVMNADSSILALSAPQIGIDKRVFCIRFNDAIKTFMNPIITKKSEYIISPETFVSMPGKEILIARPNDITVVYYNDKFKYEENKLLGPAARLFDQMAQVIDGVLPNELGLVSDVETDGSLADCTEEEINELAELYKKYIAAKTQAATDEMKVDTEVYDSYRHLKLTESVINGRATIVANDTKQPDKPNAKQQKQINQANLNNFLRRKK